MIKIYLPRFHLIYAETLRDRILSAKCLSEYFGWSSYTLSFESPFSKSIRLISLLADSKTTDVNLLISSAGEGSVEEKQNKN